MKQDTKTQDIITKHAPQPLTEAERDMLLRRISEGLGPQPTPSPLHVEHSSSFTHRNHMIVPILIGLLAFGGLGASVYASDAARPGDLLYPIDTWVEDIRLSLANEIRAEELKIQFAQERIEELRSILAEEDVRDARTSTLEAEADVFTDTTLVKIELNDITTFFTTDATSSEAIAEDIAERFGLPLERVTAVLVVEIEDRAMRADDYRDSDDESDATQNDTDDRRSSLVEAEADVFTDITVVTVELRNKKYTFTMEQGATREEIVSEIVTRFGVSAQEVERVLDLEVEDRASRPSDLAEERRFSGESEKRVNHALAVVLERLRELGFSEDDQAVMTLERVRARVGEDTRIRMRADDDRLEVRFDDDDERGRIRIENKDGEIRIRSEWDDDDDDDLDDDSRNRSDDDDDLDEDSRDDLDSDDKGLSEVEVNLYDTTARIEVEYDDQEFVHTLETTTLSAIVSFLMTEYGVTEEEVYNVLEVENKRDEQDDSDDDSDDNDEDDDSDDDDDDDDDENDDNDDDDNS